MSKITKDMRATLKDLLGDANEVQEAVGHIRDDANDFTVGRYRFIRGDGIDDILSDEIGNDEYCLGCFQAFFIAGCTGWPSVLIEAAQKGEQYEAIGKAIIAGGFVDEMAKRYAQYDGYGHHFASYDGNEHDVGSDYYAFRVD